jgi:hypothetical protein
MRKPLRENILFLREIGETPFSAVINLAEYEGSIDRQQFSRGFGDRFLRAPSGVGGQLPFIGRERKFDRCSPRFRRMRRLEII